MNVIVSGKNLQVSEGLREYVERKLGKLERKLPALSEARVEFTLEKTRDATKREVVQVTLRTNGTILRGEERASDFGTAVDIVAEKLEKQIERFKGKHYRGRAARARTEETLPEPLPDAPYVARRKKFHTPPMTEDDAIEQMELLGHNFFLFINKSTQTLNVLYRREDGNYGVIEPDV
jgi:putative sigma-54 modulation protein